MADKEYIERGALLYEVDKCEPMNWTGSDAENQADLDHGLYRGLVVAAPAADVVAVRHGEWVEQIKETLIPVEYDSNGDLILHKVIQYQCNLCGRIEGKKEPYCNCGANMDGKGEQE